MTDPDYKPSFFARLAIVVTAGGILWQVILGSFAFTDKLKRGITSAEAARVVGIYPLIAFFTVASLYYIFEGKPASEDAVVASRLYRVWALAAIGGLSFFFLI